MLFPLPLLGRTVESHHNGHNTELSASVPHVLLQTVTDSEGAIPGYREITLQWNCHGLTPANPKTMQMLAHTPSPSGMKGRIRSGERKTKKPHELRTV